MRTKLQELYQKVVTEIETAQKSVNANKHSANLISGGLVGGYSIAGDVEHSRNTARLSEDRLQKLLNLKKELSESLETAPEEAQPICLVTIETDTGAKSFYFVKNAVYLSGFSLVSPDSPLGQSLLEKKVGDVSFSGKILSIE